MDRLYIAVGSWNAHQRHGEMPRVLALFGITARSAIAT